MKAIKVACKPGMLASSTLHKLVLLLLMYWSQRVFLCFSWTLLPILLREQGASLGTIGFSALVYSPWALKFTYASFLDRTKGGCMGRRKSWIVPLLIVSAVSMPLLAVVSPETNLAVLLALVTLLNVVFATIDIAVDGYATDILEPAERPWGNTIQTVGYVLGYMLGSGVFLVVYQHVGWRTTLLMITALQLLLMVPIFLHKEIPPIDLSRHDVPGLEQTADKPRAWQFIKQPIIAWFFILAGMLMVMEQGGLQLRLPMLVDIGMDPAGLGRFNIWIGSPACILGATIGGALLAKLGRRTVFAVSCLGAAALSLFSGIISHSASLNLVSIAVMIGAEKLIAGIVVTFIYSIIMTLSVGQQSATNYAILGSLVQLIQFAIMPAAGVLCDTIGYFDLYLALSIFSFIALFPGDYILRKRLLFMRNND